MLDKCIALRKKKKEPLFLTAAHVVVGLDSLITGKRGVISGDVYYNEC